MNIALTDFARPRLFPRTPRPNTIRDITPAEFERHLNEHAPTVIHFSGHGGATGLALRTTLEISGGSLAIFLDRPLALDRADLFLLRGMADQGASAITNARVLDHAASQVGFGFGYRNPSGDEGQWSVQLKRLFGLPDDAPTPLRSELGALIAELGVNFNEQVTDRNCAWVCNRGAGIQLRNVQQFTQQSLQRRCAVLNA